MIWITIYAPTATPVHFVVSEIFVARDVIDLKLIEAVNVLADYATDHLPDGYQIECRFGKDECSICVIDPDGEDVYVDVDGSHATYRIACQTAIDDSRSVADPSR